MMRSRTVTRWAVVPCVALVSLVLAACGGSSGNDSGGDSEGLPESIPVTWLGDLSGAGAFVGEENKKGIDLAVEEINSSDMLGGSKIKIEEKDTGSEQSTAATFTSQAASSDSVAILSPALGDESLAAAPIAQRSGMPFIAMQSLADGIVEAGDYIYRATTPTPEYNSIVADELKNRGVETTAMIYVSDNPTIADAGKNVFPAHFENVGIDVVASEGTPATTTDFSALISKILNKNPDSVGAALLGPQYATVFRELRDSGFEGEIFALDGATPDILKTAGDASKGVMWATDYSPALTYESSDKFTKAFKEANGGDVPSKFSAESYDATMLLARALEVAQSTDREAIRDALSEVTAKGFDASVGPLSFGGEGNRDARALGALVEWDGNKESLIELGG